jgi:hypothetical protein
MELRFLPFAFIHLYCECLPCFVYYFFTHIQIYKNSFIYFNKKAKEVAAVRKEARKAIYVPPSEKKNKDDDDSYGSEEDDEVEAATPKKKKNAAAPIKATKGSSKKRDVNVMEDADSMDASQKVKVKKQKKQSQGGDNDKTTTDAFDLAKSMKTKAFSARKASKADDVSLFADVSEATTGDKKKKKVRRNSE